MVPEVITMATDASTPHGARPLADTRGGGGGGGGGGVKVNDYYEILIISNIVL